MTDIGDYREGEGDSNNGKENAEEAAAERLWRNVAIPWNNRLSLLLLKLLPLKSMGNVRPIVVRMVVEKKTAWNIKIMKIKLF